MALQPTSGQRGRARREPLSGSRGARDDRADSRLRDPLDPGDPRFTSTSPASRPGSDWRAGIATASGLNVLAGIWLIISPFVLGFSPGHPTWSDVICGAVVCIFALMRIADVRRAVWLSYLNALIGAWVFISAFWTNQTAAWNNLITGAVIFVVAAASASAGEDAEFAARPWYRR